MAPRGALLTLCLLLGGCASCFEYGNYCGMDRTGNGGRKAPIDAIDCACKLHDTCYGTPDDPVRCCDAAFVARLKRARCSTPGLAQSVYRELAIAYFSIPVAWRAFTGFHSPACKEPEGKEKERIRELLARDG